MPIIYSDGTNLNYYRPWRGGTDNNARDSSSYSDGISIEVFEGPPIAVSVSPTQQTINEGASVSFTASVLDPSDPGLTYQWKFDGGATDTSGSHTTTAQFSNQGDYHVTVEVTDAAGGAGDASSDITVSGNTPPQGTNTTPKTGPNQRRHPARRQHGPAEIGPQGVGDTGNSGNGPRGTKPSSSKHRPPPTRRNTSSAPQDEDAADTDEPLDLCPHKPEPEPDRRERHHATVTDADHPNPLIVAKGAKAPHHRRRRPSQPPARSSPAASSATSSRCR